MIICMVCCFTDSELLPANSLPILLMLTLHDERKCSKVFRYVPEECGGSCE